MDDWDWGTKYIADTEFKRIFGKGCQKSFPPVCIKYIQKSYTSQMTFMSQMGLEVTKYICHFSFFSAVNHLLSCSSSGNRARSKVQDLLRAELLLAKPAANAAKNLPIQNYSPWTPFPTQNSSIETKTILKKWCLFLELRQKISLRCAMWRFPIAVLGVFVGPLWAAEKCGDVEVGIGTF